MIQYLLVSFLNTLPVLQIASKVFYLPLPQKGLFPVISYSNITPCVLFFLQKWQKNRKHTTKPQLDSISKVPSPKYQAQRICSPDNK